MHINWKKTIIIALDFVLGTYLVFAFTRFNKPDETEVGMHQGEHQHSR